MGPDGGSKSSGHGVGFEGIGVTPAVDGATDWEKAPDYQGISPRYGDLKFVDEPGGKAPKPDSSGSGDNDDKPHRGGVED